MVDFLNLDKKYRLVPWMDKDHSAYVTGKYGSLLQNPQAAENYVVEYEKKEKFFDEAYEKQREFIGAASVSEGMDPQVLPDIEKIDWNPRTKFAQAKTAEEIAAEEFAKSEAKAMKDAQKAEAKAQKAAAKAAKKAA